MDATSTRPTISVIIPARNSARTLEECLDALNASEPAPHQIIVVNDASVDRTAEIARARNATVVDLPEHRDANYSRNRGAEVATGDILLFLDSDVVVQPDTLQQVAISFQTASTDAVVGLYSAYHPDPGLASQYKNLWIRYSYLNSPPAVDWVFGAVTAIRRSAFEAVGGFNTRLLAMHGNDDLELGKRMTDFRYSIVLNPAVSVVHLKRYSVRSLLRNDYVRSQAFVQLAGQLNQLGASMRKGFVNVYPRFAHSTPLSVIILSSALFGFWYPELLWIAAAGLGMYLLLNTPFLKFFIRHHGVGGGLRVAGLMFLDHLTCAAGSVKGLFRWLFRR